MYVVQGGEGVLQCGFESSRLSWYVYSGGSWYTVAFGGDVQDGSKYSVSIQSSIGLYYRLHILNVGVSDVKMYRCEVVVNGMIQDFYIELDLLGRCI